MLGAFRATHASMRGQERAEELGRLRRADYDAWARAVRGAVESAGGRLAGAARLLGVARRTVYHWVSDPCGACAGAGDLNGAVCRACYGAGRVVPATRRE